MNYLIKLFSTGAVRKSPKKVITYISSLIDTKKATIVEFGAGRGEITKAVYSKNLQNIEHYYAFELDNELSQKLRNEIPQIVIINKNAFEFDNILDKGIKVDYFICSIPLSFYSKQKVNKLLETMIERLNSNGKIIIIFNAIWLLHFFKKFKKEIKIFSTIPVYFLFLFEKG